MFHFLKDFFSAKSQVNREHIHNRINMQSIKLLRNMIIHKKPVYQLWDKCAPLMSHCVQHPISECRITDGWLAPLVMHHLLLSLKQCPGQLCFERKMRCMQTLCFALVFPGVDFKFQEYLQGKKNPNEAFHNRIMARES